MTQTVKPPWGAAWAFRVWVVGEGDTAEEAFEDAVARGLYELERPTDPEDIMRSCGECFEMGEHDPDCTRGKTMNENPATRGPRAARYEVVMRLPLSGLVLLRDLGPWDSRLTVTNDAEGVVAELTTAGLIGPGVRLWYWDSEGMLGELRHEAGTFTSYARPSDEDMDRFGVHDTPTA